MDFLLDSNEERRRQEEADLALRDLLNGTIKLVDFEVLAVSAKDDDKEKDKRKQVVSETVTMSDSAKDSLIQHSLEQQIQLENRLIELWKELMRDIVLTLKEVASKKNKESSSFIPSLSSAAETESLFIQSDNKKQKTLMAVNLAESIHRMASSNHATLEKLLREAESVVNSVSHKFTSVNSAQAESSVQMPVRTEGALDKLVAFRPADNARLDLNVVPSNTVSLDAQIAFSRIEEGLTRIDSIAFATLAGIDDMKRVLSPLLDYLSSAGDMNSLKHLRVLRSVFSRLEAMSEYLKDLRVRAHHSKTRDLSNAAA